MYKKIEIKNYGPFVDQNINLENDTSPIHIIGLNDVGKTALLNAIQAPCFGLNKKYMHKENSSVKVFFEIKEKYYLEELINEMKSEFKLKKLFTGEVSLTIRGNELQKDVNLFRSNENIKEFTNNIISITNNSLSEKNKILDLKISDKALMGIIQNINNKQKNRQKI